MADELTKGDNVTVVMNDSRLFRARVEAAWPEHGRFVIWPAWQSTADGKIKDYFLADEGITWVRGFHERGAPELASLLAYVTMQ